MHSACTKIAIIATSFVTSPGTLNVEDDVDLSNQTITSPNPPEDSLNDVGQNRSVSGGEFVSDGLGNHIAKMNGWVEQISQGRKRAEDALSSTDQVASLISSTAERVIKYDQLLGKLDSRLDSLQRKVTRLENSLRARDLDIRKLGASLFEDYEDSMRFLVKATEKELDEISRLAPSEQIVQLQKMQSQSNQQVAKAIALYGSIRASEVLNIPAYDERHSRIVTLYEKLIDQTTSMLGKQIEMEKQWFCDSLKVAGASQECAQFHYAKMIVLSYLKAGKSVLKQPPFNLHMTDSDLNNVKDKLASMSYEEYGRFQKVSTKDNGLKEAATLMGKFLRKATLLDKVADVLRSPDDRKSLHEISEKYFAERVEKSKEIIDKKLLDSIHDCYGMPKLESPGIMELIKDYQPRRATIGSTAKNTPPSPEVQQCIDNARELAREELSAEVEAACKDLNAGSIEKCFEIGVLSPKAAVLDNLSKLANGSEMITIDKELRNNRDGSNEREARPNENTEQEHQGSEPNCPDGTDGTTCPK